MTQPGESGEKAPAAESNKTGVQKRRQQMQSALSKTKFEWKKQLIWVVIGAVGTFLIEVFIAKPDSSWAYWLPVLLIGAFSAVLYPITIWFERLGIQSEMGVQARFSSTVLTDELDSTSDEEFFKKLVQINFKYLEQYYLQTGLQADKSFTLTAFVAIVAFAIVVAGVILMFVTKSEAAIVTAGAGILSEFIAAVFFYFYNQTVTKMAQYHQKLVLTQNISLAMKITEKLPEGPDRVTAQKELIHCLTQDINKYLTASSEAETQKQRSQQSKH